MRMFSRLYDRILIWSAHRHAPRYLAALSFAESSFFPLPPDVMLVPMVLATPRRAWHYAALTTVASVLGGIAGYLLGLYAFDLIEPLLQRYGHFEGYQQATEWFSEWGVWVVFIAGFSPIPYKVFTISAGVMSMAFLPFILASVVGRGARFFLVATVITLGGERMAKFLRDYIDGIGWLTLLVLVIAYLSLR